MPTPSISALVRPDSIAVLTIDQPGSKVNVLTRQLWTELGDAVASLSPRTDLRGLVIASGKHGTFIAGADLKLLADAPGPNDPAVRTFIEIGLRVLENLEALPFPTCAAIDGTALGGGLEVALACDNRVVGTHPKVQLGFPEVRLGLIPGWGGTQRLPRLVGMFVAAEMLMEGKGVDALEAVASGLVSKAVDSGQLVDEAVHLLMRIATWQADRAEKRAPLPAVEIAAKPPEGTLSHAAHEVIRAMTDGASLPLYEGIELETEAFMNLAGSPESKQRIAEFFASRKR